MKTILKSISLSLALFAISCNRDNEMAEKEIDMLKTGNTKEVFSAKPTLGPNDDPSKDGAFIIDALNGKVYVKFEGKLRHILALETFEGVFKRKEIYLFPFLQQNMLYNTLSTSFGDSIGPNTELIRHISTGQIYLVQGNTIRYIPDMNVANRYRFNLNYVRNVSDISNYTILSPITITR